MAETADVVVIGGGSTGTSIAWQLAKMGAGRVVLLERHGLAAQATGVTAGIVRTHYTHETLARMALRARHIFENFGDVVGGDAGFRQAGFLALLGPDDIDTVAANIAMHRELGINTYILSPDEIRGSRAASGAVRYWRGCLGTGIGVRRPGTHHHQFCRSGAAARRRPTHRAREQRH